MRIGHVRVGSDDFMQTSIISRRRHRRLRRVFLTLSNFRSRRMMIRYMCSVKEIVAQSICRGRQEIRTYVLGVREPVDERGHRPRGTPRFPCHGH